MSRYKLKSIEKIVPPEGTTHKRWYKFIIANSYNTITNIRCGNEKEIRKFAATAIQRLNEKYLTNCKVKVFNRPVNEVSISGSF
jgi:hypothetical protein